MKSIFEDNNPIFIIKEEFAGHNKFKQFTFKKDYYVTQKALIYAGFTEILIKKLQYDTIRLKTKEENIDIEKTIDITILNKWEHTFDNPIKKEKNSIEKVKDHLIRREFDQATEYMVQEFLNKNSIYTTRNDIKSEIWIYQQGIYIPQGRTYIQEYVRGILGDVYVQRLTNIIISKIEVDTFIDEKKFFNNNYIDQIPVENGILNIKTKTLTEFTPKKIFFNKLPVVFDPNKNCPTIIKHMQTVLSKNDDIVLMQEIFGYTLIKDHFIEKAFMFNGTGRNGKSKTIELMKKMLGVENVINIPIQNLEKDDFTLCELHGKMANICGEISSSALNNTGNFKSLTGRDEITAKRKFLTSISFVSYAKMIFACNELPRSADNSIAFWSRWVYIDFPYTFKTQEEINDCSEEERNNLKVIDTQISQKMDSQDEISGLLNWSLEGLQRILKIKDFTSTQTHKQIQTEWSRKADSVLAFASDFIEEDYDSCIEKKDFRKWYMNYCKFHKVNVLTDKVIRESLKKNFSVDDGRIRLENDQLRVWDGIKFKEEFEVVRQVSQSSQRFSTTSEFCISSYRAKFHVSDVSPVSENPTLGYPVVYNVILPCYFCGGKLNCTYASDGKPICEMCHSDPKIQKKYKIEEEQVI